MKIISTRFYTDTAFVEDKSMLGNDCVQIFTDGDGFVVALPMQSKDEAGDKLQAVCRNVGVTNELHMYNAPYQTVYNKIFQEVCREKNQA